MDAALINDSLAQLDSFLWPVEEPRQRRKRERILKAATENFVQLGYRKTTIELVAQHAGVAKGTVYLYYPTKAALITHAIALEKREHLARLTPVMDSDATAAEMLRNFIALGLAMAAEMPLTASLIRGEREIEVALGEMDEDLLANINREQVAWLASLLEAATEHQLNAEQLALRSQALRDLIFAVSVSGPLMGLQSAPVGARDSEYCFALADLMVNGAVHSASPRIEQPLLTALTG